MFRYSLALVIWIVSIVPVQAQISPEMQRLTDVLGLPEIIEVMRQEGIDYGDELAESMFPGGSTQGWREAVSDIYDPERMRDVALTGFGEALDGDSIAALTDFFESDLGVEVIALEISARRALMDDAVDAANKAHVAQLFEADDPRIELLQQFIDVNDLLETNVEGALNSNFAFYTGLVDGGAYPEPVTEDKILSDVWGQEPEIRADTDEWLFGFLSMAYSPLSDEDLLAYIEFSKTDAGQALNTALFAGFSELFDGISNALGHAAARVMSSEDL